MHPIRILFVVFTLAAMSGVTYAAYYGRGGESSDLDRSVRIGSGGVGALAGRVK